MFRLIDITIDITFFSINWKNYFDRSILVISMTVLSCSTGELGYDGLNGTMKIGPSYAKSVVYIWQILHMHRTGTKHIVRHMQISVIQWSVISKFTCTLSLTAGFSSWVNMRFCFTGSQFRGLAAYAPNVSFGHPEHCFLTVWTPKSLCQNLLMMTFLKRQKM